MGLVEILGAILIIILVCILYGVQFMIIRHALSVDSMEEFYGPAVASGLFSLLTMGPVFAIVWGVLMMRAIWLAKFGKVHRQDAK